MAFTDEIREEAEAVWMAILEHPMVRELGAGTLEEAPFRHWVRQENVEMDLHRSYAAEFGISEAELEATEPSPTTRAYTDFLVRIAALGTFGELVAVLLPCMWGFNETGKRLAAGGLPEDERYVQWVDTYAGEEFTELTGWCLDLMDEVAADATASDRERPRAISDLGPLRVPVLGRGVASGGVGGVTAGTFASPPVTLSGGEADRW